MRSSDLSILACLSEAVLKDLKKLLKIVLKALTFLEVWGLEVQKRREEKRSEHEAMDMHI